MKGDADDDAGQHEGHGHHPAQQIAAGEGAPVEDKGAGDAEGHAHGGAEYRLGEGLREDPPGALAGQDLAEAAQVQGAVGGEAAAHERGHGPGEEDRQEGQWADDGQGPAGPLAPTGPGTAGTRPAGSRGVGPDRTASRDLC